MTCVHADRSRPTSKRNLTRRRRFVVCTAAIFASASALIGWPSGSARGQTRPLPRAGSTGTLQGVVKLTGAAPPRPTRVQNTTDPTVCGRAHTLEDWVISPQARGVQYVILDLENIPPDQVPPVSPARLVLDNSRCRFVPHASVLTVGSTIEMVNSDAVLHSVHFYGPMDVNIALPLKNMRVSRRVDAAGMIIVKCDVHGWMQSFVRVDAHPFHAVTDAAGSFRIAGVPPGEFVLHAWHEKLGDRRQTVRVRAGEVTTLAIESSFELK